MTGKPNRGGRPSTYPESNGPFNEWIDERMRQLGIESYNEFADRFGIGRSTLSNLRRGRQSPTGAWMKADLRTLERLANALDKSLGEVLDRFYESEGQMMLVRAKAQVLGWVGAGPGMHKVYDQEGVLVEASFARGKDLVAFKVKGDSMCSGKKPICDGDIIVVDRLDKGYNGAEVVAYLGDNTYVCKMLKEDSTGTFLVSKNPAVSNGAPAIIPIDQVDEIVGRVVRVIKDI